MTFRRLVILLIVTSAIMAVTGLYFQFLNIYSEMSEELKDVSTTFSQNIKDMMQLMSITDVIENARIFPSGIKGIIEMNDDGKIIRMYGDFSNYTKILYDFSFVNGTYISPLENSNGKPLITLATRSGSNVIAVQVDPRQMLSFEPGLYVVDQTGFGVSNDKWKTFMSILAQNSDFVLEWPYLFVKQPTYGNYALIAEAQIPSLIYSVISANVSLYILILIVFALITFFYIHSKKQNMPVQDFLNFLSEIDTFKRYKNGEQKFIKNYNNLVNEWDRISKSYTSLIEELGQTNANLIKFNDLYAELPMIFERVDNEESFENAMKILSRRILDLSICIKGVGIKYNQKTFVIGTVTLYNFRDIGSKFHLELKTHANVINFILDLDRFITTDIFKELLLSLFNHIASIISMYELRKERNESARYDPLTELLTRQEFTNLVFREIEILKRERESSAFVIMDIKNFKQYNERYGHFEGDVLMKFIAKLIKTSTRITDISCRWGEDSFAIYFANFKKTDMMAKETEIISKIKEFKHDLNVKIGVSYYPQDGESFEELMRLAEERSEQLPLE